MNDSSKLKLANLAFREGRYQIAIGLYQHLLQEDPKLYKSISHNIKLAQKKAESERVSASSSIFSLVNADQMSFIEFQAANAIEILSDSQNYSFKAQNEDPYFLINPSADLLMLEGWYEIHLLISNSLEENEAKLYIDYGDGYNEDHTFALPYKTKESFKRVLFFKNRPIAIRFDPADSVCSFNIPNISFVKLDQIEASKKIQDFIQQNIPNKITKEDLVFKSGKNELDDESLLRIYEDIYNPFFSIKYGVDKSYVRWICDIEKPRIPGSDAIQEALLSFISKPLISILIPTYNSNLKFLHECLDSVLNQTYPHWELCIADDASSDDQVRQTLLQYAAKDNRIKLEFRRINGHICEASNSALKLATGEYVLLLDHDDLLAKEALFFLIESINQFPQAEIIYSDEDKVDPDGKRFDPHFKSDFNLDLLYSHNYISHLGVYKRDLLESIGGFRKGLEGAQDYDLLLRCILKVNVDKIIHIPKILYHWRASINSTALTSSNKAYTSESGLKALTDYFRSKGNRVDIFLGETPNTYRASWAIPDKRPLISLIIPTRDRLDILKQCISSILERTSYQNYEILIVDNDSVEHETLEYFKHIQSADTRVRVLHFPGEFNYSKINNWAVERSRGELIGLINNDIEVISSEWLTEMISHALRPDIGAVGAKLLYMDDSIQHAGVILGIGGVAGHSHKYYTIADQGYFSRLKLVQNYSAVTAACMVLRKELFQILGGLDEHNLKIAFNDVDFCIKIRELGYRNLWTPFALLYHHESISRGVENTPEKQARFMSESKFMKEKWGDKLKVDPLYNLNLTLIHEDFSLAVN